MSPTTDANKLIKAADKLLYNPVTMSTKRAEKWFDSISHSIKPCANGKFQPTDISKTVTSAFGDIKLTVQTVSSQKLDIWRSSIKAAADAITADAQITSGQRSKLLYSFKSSLKQTDLLTELLCLQSSSISSSQYKSAVVPYLTSVTGYYAGLAAAASADPALKALLPLGVHVCAVGSHSCIAEVLYAVTSSLSAGNALILLVDSSSDVLFALHYIIHLLISAGFTSGLVSFIVTDDVVSLLNSSTEGVAALTVCGAPKETSNAIQVLCSSHGIRFSSLHEGRGVSVVYESSDLESAVQDAVDAFWCSRSMFPMSSVLLVQENILDSFTQRLQIAMERLRVGTAGDQSVDLVEAASSPRRAQLLAGIKEEGGQIIGSESGPTLVVGIQMSSPVLLQITSQDAILPLLPFRTIKESVAMVQKLPDVVCASLWSEHTNVLNEVTDKLQCQTITYNCHHKYDALTRVARVTCSTGAPGLQALSGVMKSASSSQLTCTEPIQHSSKAAADAAVVSAVKAAKLAQHNWSSLPAVQRCEMMLTAAAALHSSNHGDAAERLVYWATQSYRLTGQIVATQFTGHTTTINSPLGTIALRCASNMSLVGIIDLVARSIVQGNSLVLLVASDAHDEIAKMLKSSSLPAGVVTLINHTYGDVTTQIVPLVDCVWYWGDAAGQRAMLSIATQTSVPCVVCGDAETEISINDARFDVTKMKYVWSPSGEIFAN